MKRLDVAVTLTDEEFQTFEAFCGFLALHRDGEVEDAQAVEVALSHFLARCEQEAFYVYSAAEREK